MNFTPQFCAILCAAILTLTSCGFTPLYGDKAQQNNGQNQTAERTNIVAANADFDITVIPNQEGVYLRNLLIDRLYTNGYPQNPRYQLVVSPIATSEQSLAIAKSSESTRGQIRQKTRIELRDRQTASVVLARDLMALSSYNILVSEFATRVTEENARKNGLNDLARQIELQLGLYFNRNNNLANP